MSGYIGPLPVPQGIQRKQSFTATASQTTFNTNGYTDGNFINVYLNGVRLINGTDYTATNGSDIVLTTGASASDVLDFETFDTFELVNQTFENVTLKNPTHEDTDGGRESAVLFKGEQSGGEISTLAQIQASHDGTSDDQKGDLIFKTNDGSDNDAPTEAMRITSDQRVGIGETAPATNLHISSTANPAISIEDTDNGFAATTLQVENGGRDLDITVPQDTIFTQGSTEAMRIDENGNTGIGVNAPRHRLDVRQAATGAIPTDHSIGVTDVNDNYIGFMNTDNSATYSGFALQARQTGAARWLIANEWQETYKGDLVFRTRDGGTSSSESIRLLNEGGITFNGDTAAVNSLNDYEEGTWTPTYTGASSNPTVTYDIQGGTYRKIGKIVFFSIQLGTDAVSGGSGQVQVSGFPYTPSETPYFRVVSYSWDGSNTTYNSKRPDIMYITSGGTNARFWDAGTSALQVSDLNTTTNDNRLFVNGWFFTSS